MEFVELKKHLKSSKPKPCYCAFGDDDFLIERAVTLIGGLVSAFPEFNNTDKEFQKQDELIEELARLPVMSDYRVVVARGKVDAGVIEQYLGNPNPQAVLVVAVLVPHDSWGHSATVEIPNGAEPVVCNRLPVRHAEVFIKSIADGAGVTIDQSAVDELYARCGGYMTRINTETKKLVSQKSPGGVVEKADVAATVKADVEFVVFELADSILAENRLHALEIVDGMAKNNDLTAAFTLLYNRFKRIFAAVVDPDGLPDLGVKPNQIGRLKADGAKFSRVRLKRIVDLLASADYGYKSGAMSQYDALVSVIVQA
ncbi:MAG: hypothetical protein J1G04_02915 [Clostridiales bacterium]|nr:hypothetical protein [Clostridiales bacterium]